MNVLGMHTYPRPLHSSWFWDTLIQSSNCQIAQFMRSKIGQTGEQFFYQMSDFCENCNPHSSYHTTTVCECLVDIGFAGSCKLTLFTFLETFISLKKGNLLHAQTGSLNMQFCMYMKVRSTILLPRPKKENCYIGVTGWTKIG